MKTHHVTNCVVWRETLASIRARHPLLTEATLYAPGRYEIGHGNRNDVMPHSRITACMAEDLLRSDVMYVEAFIRLAVARPVHDRTYQALVSYLFDVGPRSQAARSRLAALHERGRDGFFDGLAGAADESRFGAHIGRTARFFEMKLSDL